MEKRIRLNKAQFQMLQKLTEKKQTAAAAAAALEVEVEPTPRQTVSKKSTFSS